MKTCPKCGEPIRTVTVFSYTGQRREDWVCERGHRTENAVVHTRGPQKKKAA